MTTKEDTKHPPEDTRHLPKGVIMMFAGNEAPPGWAICDGMNGTPDLRGRCVVGAGHGIGLSERVLHSVGGEEKHVLTLPEMPPHNHFTCYGTINGDSSSRIPYAADSPKDIGQSAAPHNVMQPFYVLSFIIKL